MSKARKFVIMVLLDTVLRAVPILVNTIRFGAANNLNFFSLVFLRLFSQLLANDISPNNCSIKKLINFAEGIIFNPLMSAQPFVFSTCFKRHSFGQQPNSLYLFLKVSQEYLWEFGQWRQSIFAGLYWIVHMYGSTSRN